MVDLPVEAPPFFFKIPHSFISYKQGYNYMSFVININISVLPHKIAYVKKKDLQYTSIRVTGCICIYQKKKTEKITPVLIKSRPHLCEQTEL